MIIPAGTSVREAIAGEELRRHIVEHVGRRGNLTMDQLAEATDVRARCETPDGIKLKGDSRGHKNRIYYFSIDATVKGMNFRGCLFAGNCILVQATSFEKAQRLAGQGLRETPELARDYFDKMASAIVAPSGNPIVDGLEIDVRGQHSSRALDQPDLATDPKLKAIIAHQVGKLPYKY